MRKACFVIPYFGKMPSNFRVFLKTCRENPEFDWLIITNDEGEYPYAGNVHVKIMQFSEFVNRVQDCFDFRISLERPYKICDYRAAFGIIFAEELKEYLFWGHCDTDEYFGNIASFITDDVLQQYDKILCLGHFTLFRNIPEINGMYLVEDKKYRQSYRDAFTTGAHWIFDEWPKDRTSINRIFKQQKVKTFYNSDCFCDLVPFKSCFRRTLLDQDTEEWTLDTVKNEVYLWDCGQLYRCWNENGSLQKEKILYVHIRQRAMCLKAFDEQQSSFLIVPNRIISKNMFSDAEILKYLRSAELRGLYYPDEIARKAHNIRTLFCLAVRRIKRLAKRQ